MRTEEDIRREVAQMRLEGYNYNEICDRLDIPFDDAMLSWPPGPRDTDGIWARHWYDAVEASTGFKAYRPKDDILPERHASLHDECVKLYEELHQDRIVA